MNEMFGSNQSLESVDVIRQGIPWGGLRLKAELCRCPPPPPPPCPGQPDFLLDSMGEKGCRWIKLQWAKLDNRKSDAMVTKKTF